MNCSAPDCAGEAVLQWQRPATADEALAWRESFRAQAATIVEGQRLNLRQAIYQIGQMRDAIRDDNPDATLLRQRCDDAATAVQAELDQTADPQLDLPGDATVAVFGCEDHSMAGVTDCE